MSEQKNVLVCASKLRTIERIVQIRFISVFEPVKSIFNNYTAVGGSKANFLLLRKIMSEALGPVWIFEKKTLLLSHTFILLLSTVMG